MSADADEARVHVRDPQSGTVDNPMSSLSGAARRAIDLALAVPGAVLSLPLVALLVVAATIDTREVGLYRQARIGRRGTEFMLYKIRTMKSSTDATTVTVAGDERITRLGALLRRSKLDELPQLWNVARGEMSLVGPRPDVAGYADNLTGDDRRLLEMRPGITGPATLLFRNEEELLAGDEDAQTTNDRVIWPLKVRINLAYQKCASLKDQLEIIDMTIRGADERLASMLERWDPDLRSDDTVASLLAPQNSP